MLKKLFRIIDANVNRASEGLRVLEDLARFYYDSKVVSREIKKFRHKVRENIMKYISLCIKQRNSSKDVGLTISKETKIDNKTSLKELTTANFKRVQEALRTLEENLKVIGEYQASKVYESLRFESYSIEKDFFSIITKSDKKQKLDTDLYCITAEKYSKGKTNIQVVDAMIKAGIKVIQYREKDKEAKEKYEECLKLRKMTQKAGVTFIVNDDVDIAILVKADGIHIGQDDLPIEKVRQLVPEDMIIGLSTHNPDQARDAVKRGADYIGVGPIFKTYTKENVCDPVGLEYLEYVVKNINIPFVAIGGIKEHNVLQVKEKGAKCISMVTEIVGSENIESKISDIRQKIG